jgi:hypothetical protein
MTFSIKLKIYDTTRRLQYDPFFIGCGNQAPKGHSSEEPALSRLRLNLSSVVEPAPFQSPIGTPSSRGSLSSQSIFGGSGKASSGGDAADKAAACRCALRSGANP